MSYSSEDHCCRIQTIRLGSTGQPFITALQLMDTMTSWLQVGESTDEDQMFEQNVMEQFVEELLTLTSEWVAWWPPLPSQRIILENHATAHGPWPAPHNTSAGSACSWRSAR